MTIAWETFALWGAVGLSLAMAATTLAIGLRLLASSRSVLERIDASGDRIGAGAASLCDELGTLYAANETQRRQLEKLGRQIDHLAADVARRETWKGQAPVRHGGVMEAVRDGRDVDELVREHGLSPDEAELLVLLHGGGSTPAEAVR